MRLLMAALILAGSAFAQDAKVVVLSPDVYLMKTATAFDGKWVSHIDRSRFHEISVSPGEHRVCVVTPKFKHVTPAVITVTLKPGETYYLNETYLDGLSKGSLQASLISEDQATLLMRARKQADPQLAHIRVPASFDPECK